MLVREHGHRPIRPRDYEEALQNFIQQAIEAYQSNQLFGSAEEKSKHFDDFRKLLEERCQEKISSNKDRYRDIQMAEAVNGAYEVYEKGMRPDFVESLEKNKKAEFVRDRHKKAFPEAMTHFENVVQDFLDEPDLIEYKRNLLNEMIQARYEDLQQDNAIQHLHQQAEFVADVAIALPKISPDMVEHLLDNYRDSQLAQFKKCEDSFEMEVRHNLKVGALNKQMEDLHFKQAEDKKRLESLEEETNTQIGEMNEQLVEERRLRVEAESGGSNMQGLLAMMKAMNENSQAQMEQMRHERAERIAREERDRQERERRYEIDMEMMRMEQQERARRDEVRDQERRDDTRMQQEAMERQRQAHEAEMAEIRNRPPPPPPKLCSIMDHGKELDYQVVQRQFAHQQWQDFEKVTNLNRATLEILIENSNSRRTFFLQTLVKNGYDQELKNVLNWSLAKEWMMFFEKVPRNDLCFEEMQDFAYKVAHRLSIQFPPSLMQYLDENFQRSVRHHQNVSFQHGPLGHQGQNPAQHQHQKSTYV
ncbi:unnamed protein product, partial [Mesorhabditis belari]|uniref:Uncharacterized protein n=1 Tax=Mesorhabditis belari TaxID=2138241 RepID=A0AAF3F0F3_9BILA